MTALADAHITAQERLRQLVAQLVARIWRDLPGYDEPDVAPFITAAVPIVLAAQRQAVALTEAFIARSIGRAPLGVDPGGIIGSAARNGTPPEQVYRRPFVTVWSELGNSRQWEDAVNAGLNRVTSTAQTDVQLAMRGTLRAVAEADKTILGYARVPDAGACVFCRLVSGQRYTKRDLMPIHNHCGCGVEVITAENRHEFTGNPLNDLTVTGDDGTTAAVREHGELGPVLTNGDHHFTTEEAL